MPRSFGGTEILTIKEVSDYLKVTERTIYRLAATKKIPAFKVGGSWRFSLVDIDRWIKQQSIEGLTASKTMTSQPSKEEGNRDGTETTSAACSVTT
jgi:excisionase family DNA binding protein